ncbi:hypothetical protein BE20_15055 [Sorangium cellulosum]|nr:hypothetical protein BE20_15055 [Sorangium cellulosum]
MQRRRAGAELLEHDEIDAAGPEVEHLGQRLEPEVGAEPGVRDPRGEADEAVDQPVRAQVDEGDDRRLERGAHGRGAPRSGSIILQVHKPAPHVSCSENIMKPACQSEACL